MSIAEIVNNLNKLIKYNDTPYRITACIMRKRGTDIFYQVELRDESTSVDSLLIVSPEEVKMTNMEDK